MHGCVSLQTVRLLALSRLDLRGCNRWIVSIDRGMQDSLFMAETARVTILRCDHHAVYILRRFSFG